MRFIVGLRSEWESKEAATPARTDRPASGQIGPEVELIVEVVRGSVC